MVDEFTAICKRFWSNGCQGRVQIAEKSLNAKLWQENLTHEQSTRF